MYSPDIDGFLASVEHRGRRDDAATLVALFARVTGQQPELWRGSIVGYGHYHYRYDSGREGDAPAAAFSPRKSATSIYLNDGVDAHADLLGRLGPHTTGVSCVYLKTLAGVDLNVLEEIVRRSYATLTDGTHTRRAREGGRD